MWRHERLHAFLCRNFIRVLTDIEQLAHASQNAMQSATPARLGSSLTRRAAHFAASQL
jgi:hypothetical protein